MADGTFKFKTDALNLYMAYIENTESPRLFHLWSFLGCIGAVISRKAWVKHLDEIYPNMYVSLVGPPATKKNAAINTAVRLVREACPDIRFAPDDTGGARQGLLKAMAGSVNDIEDVFESVKASDKITMTDFLDDEEMKQTAFEALKAQQFDTRDRHSMFAVATELGSLLGQGSFDLMTFLIKVFDGEDYDYGLGKSQTTLKEGLLSLLGGTTPVSLAKIVPPEAQGQGFMSRIIFVYGDTKYKDVTWPSRETEMAEEIKDHMRRIYNQFEGEIAIGKIARNFIDDIYKNHKPNFNDPRFLNYLERRVFPHLIKLSIIICALRGGMEISVIDISEALTILSITEQRMPDALGEYGLSPLAASKQKLIEFLTMANRPLDINILWLYMQRDMRRHDFVTTLAELTHSGKIMAVQTADGGQSYITKEKKKGSGGLDLFNEAFPPGSKMIEEDGRLTELDQDEQDAAE